MAFCMTENQERVQRIKWNLSQLTPEDIDFCRAEARRLFNNPYVQHEPNDSEEKWLDCIAENVRIRNDHHRAQYCAEMED